MPDAPLCGTEYPGQGHNYLSPSSWQVWMRAKPGHQRKTNDQSKPNVLDKAVKDLYIPRLSIHQLLVSCECEIMNSTVRSFGYSHAFSKHFSFNTHTSTPPQARGNQPKVSDYAIARRNRSQWSSKWPFALNCNFLGIWENIFLWKIHFSVQEQFQPKMKTIK